MNKSEGKEIRINVGDIGFSIKWEGSKVIDWPSKAYKGFTSPESIDVSLNVKCGELPEVAKGDIVFDAETNWKMYQTGESYIIDEFDVRTHKKDRTIKINKSMDRGEVFILPEAFEGMDNFFKRVWNGSQNCWSIHRLIDPFLKLLAANRLTKDDAVLVHGLSVSLNGKGILFAGSSGTGKSTLAGLLQGEDGITILNDERSVLSKKDGDLFIQGTPWPGDALISAPDKVRLDKVFFLKHSAENNIKPESIVNGFNMLFPQFFLPFWDKSAINWAMSFCEGVVKKVNPSELGFVKNKSVVDFIRKNCI